MAQFGDILSRLFTGGGTRGLSGDSERVLPPEGDVFNDFLRRHRTEGDLIADPGWLWSASSSVLRRQKGGLSTHLMDHKSDTIADFTDILFILSQADGRRARGAWQQKASSLLHTRFLVFCDEEDYHLLFPLRPARFSFLTDGGPEMDGDTLGLRAGEFVTGLLPNLYTGPVEGSRAEISVLANLPGQWQGYREIGRLYNDQMQFTLGTHWLDSFHHKALARPLLYRLQQYADGSLVHVIHPDLQESYRVKSHTATDGVSVLSIVDRRNHPLIHLILSVVEDELGPMTPSVEPVDAPAPGIQLPPGPPVDLLRSSTAAGLTGSPQRTVVPLDLDSRIFRLRECGALLQRVHFNKFMEGYDVYLGLDGTLQTASSEPAATFQVRGRLVTLVGHRPGLVVDGQPLSVGAAVPLKRNISIGLGNEIIEYRDLSNVAADGWPYLGEIRRSAGNTTLVFGGVYRIGRDKSAKVRLPDEPENDNIVWLPGVVDGATIRSRTGDIPKSRFYTDSIMVASLHSEVDLRNEPTLISLARHCYTFIRRKNEIISLTPVDKAGGLLRAPMQSGDEILVGNCVFEVHFPPAGGLDHGDDASDQAAPPPLLADDLPAAAGLGERGPRPPAAQFTRVDTDSFDESAGVGRGAQLALAGSAPSSFGEPVQIQKSGPRLVFDEDFDAPFRRVDSLPGVPVPSLAEVAAALHEEPTRPRGVTLADAESPTEGADTATRDRPEPFAQPDDSQAYMEVATTWMAVVGTEDLGEPTEVAEPVREAPAEPVRDEVVEPVLEAPAEPDSSPIDDDALLAPVEAPSEPVQVLPEEEPEPLDEPAERDDAPFDEDPADDEDLLVVPVMAAPPPEPGAWVVREEDWQIELARPAHLVVTGWMLRGEAVISNHDRAGIALPENQTEAGQKFAPLEYFSLRIRGPKTELMSLGTPDSRLLRGDKVVQATDDGAHAAMIVTRRDDRGDPDFELRLTLEDDPSLPDPRAQLVRLDLSERVARAMFTIGLPLRAPRALALGPIRASGTFDGMALRLSGYLPSYRSADGFHPFFVRHGLGAWRTVSEDGADLLLEPGDRLMAGATLYVFSLA